MPKRETLVKNEAEEEAGNRSKAAKHEAGRERETDSQDGAVF